MSIAFWTHAMAALAESLGIVLLVFAALGGGAMGFFWLIRQAARLALGSWGVA